MDPLPMWSKRTVKLKKKKYEPTRALKLFNKTVQFPNMMVNISKNSQAMLFVSVESDRQGENEGTWQF